MSLLQEMSQKWASEKVCDPSVGVQPACLDSWVGVFRSLLQFRRVANPGMERKYRAKQCKSIVVVASRHNRQRMGTAGDAMTDIGRLTPLL